MHYKRPIMTTRTSIPAMPEITTRTGSVLSEGRSALDAEDLRVRVQKALDEFLSQQVAVLDDVSGRWSRPSPICSQVGSGSGRHSAIGGGGEPAPPTTPPS